VEFFSKTIGFPIHTQIKIQIPGHNNKLRPIDSDYIYLISYKIAKKANPRKRICPI